MLFLCMPTWLFDHLLLPPCLQDGNIHVVLEYMDRGSLSDVIHGWRGMDYGEDLMAAVTLQARPWVLF